MDQTQKSKPSKQIKKNKPQRKMKKAFEFKEVFDQGKVFRGKQFSVWVFFGKSKKAPLKSGIIVSRKVSASAVVRNRWRRRIDEIFRANEKVFKDNVSVAVKVKEEQELVPSTKKIKTELFELLEKAKVL